jgi:hypothetical protein
VGIPKEKKTQKELPSCSTSFCSVSAHCCLLNMCILSVRLHTDLWLKGLQSSHTAEIVLSGNFRLGGMEFKSLERFRARFETSFHKKAIGCLLGIFSSYAGC